MRDRAARRIRPRLPAALLASALACLAAPAGAAAVTETFEHTGAAQSFTVPAGVTEVTVDAYGGAGGSAGGGLIAGGLGGRATATIPVTPGEALQVNVGGAGANGVPNAGPSFQGGFNGGGSVSNCVGAANGGAGGGASDLRRDADAAGGYELDERLVVAGGGGGGKDTTNATGGAGGGTSGGPGGTVLAGGGGTQTAGGAGGTTIPGGQPGQPGQLGAGGDGAICSGAGGGGLYGGGSGAVFVVGGGGGGGSGFTPDGAGMTNGVRAGNGQVVLTYTLPTSPPSDSPPPDGTAPPTPSEFTRTLGIAYSERKDRFKGKLASTSPACISGKRVKVFEQQKGKDPKLGSDATDQRGRYSLKEENADGRFYAQVNQRGVPGGTCLAARSETIKVG